jgi:hypothetical protein
MHRTDSAVVFRHKLGEPKWYWLHNRSLSFKPFKDIGAQTTLTYCGHVFGKEVVLSPGSSQLSPSELREIFEQHEVTLDAAVYSVDTFPAQFELQDVWCDGADVPSIWSSTLTPM